MVIASAIPAVIPAPEISTPAPIPEPGPAWAPGPVVKPTRTGSQYCGRCETRLIMGYDEPQCLSCGYADYSYTPEPRPASERSIVSTATRFVVRYSGDFPTLTETLAHVRLIRVRNRVVYAVNCPFCEKAMDQSFLSGKRPEVREQRYKCMDGHRVSLVPGRNGMLGWK